MAPSATNGDSASLDDLKPPPGVVLPPKEIRNILEKTAGYVARNGNAFEDRIRDKERQNPKFSFLAEGDAYHPFYEWRLSEIRAGRGTAVAAGRVGEGVAPAEQKPKGPPKPPDFQFSARMPRLNQKDLDVLRLTALFVAKNGRPFMTQLAQREAGNPQFQFLIPNHTFHNFFQSHVDQYTTLLRASGLAGEGGRLQEERVAELRRNVEDKYHVLARARQRGDYARFMDTEKQARDEEEQRKREEFARIDWNDFVVVETIVFNEADDQAALPPPTSLSDLQYASLEDRKQMSISSSMRIEEAMPTEDMNASYNPYQAQPQQPAAWPLPVHAGYAPQPQAYQAPESIPVRPSVQMPQRSAEEEEEARRIQERADAQARMQQAQSDALAGGANMKIRDNYVPRAAQKAASRQGQTMAICPNCKQQFPISELSEHMRIELLDPRWREQKAKAESRYATTNVTTADVANNLKRLASQRTDVFDDVTGQPVGSAEEEARRKKAATTALGYEGAVPPMPDLHSQPVPGLPPGFGAPKVNVEEQIARIHQRFAK